MTQSPDRETLVYTKDTMTFYEVAPLKIVRPGSTVLTYHSDKVLQPGNVVAISVGSRKMTGIVWRKVLKPTYKTKQVEHIYYSQTTPVALLKTAQWMSEYYSTHLATVLQTVLPSGLTKKRRESTAKATTPITRKKTEFALNKKQETALKTIVTASGKTVLLHGVTGAGKTAVYISYAKQVVATGKSVIVLTPEISLTPQLTAEFSQHFEDVAITHSQLTESQRHQLWQRVLENDKPMVIIGPRSALFMPVQKLGAIIIDECHEPSFKQEQQPRYQAARVARILANHHKATLVLGSATPGIVDYYMAEKHGVITTLDERAKPAIQPTIHVIDAGKRDQFVRNQLFSTYLLEAMAKQLSQKRQVLLFHNRRGTASSALCEKCGWHAACERCMLPLTLHADEGKLRCHVCGEASRIPPHCPQCSHADIIFKGVGTKRLESEVQKLFPRARVARFDADAQAGDRLHEQYQAVYDGDIDILIGTQLIAKGLDLPRLGMVGLVQADAGLLLPDFAARERTFQLISQACGRVGRQDHATDVIVQTYYSQDPVVKAGVNERYSEFYGAELLVRKRGHYPPFTHLLKLVCAYKTESGAVKASRTLAKDLRMEHLAIEVVGPTPAFYERLRGLYRWQITVKSGSRQTLQKIAHDAPKNWQAELDPHSLLS